LFIVTKENKKLKILRTATMPPLLALKTHKIRRVRRPMGLIVESIGIATRRDYTLKKIRRGRKIAEAKFPDIPIEVR